MYLIYERFIVYMSFITLHSRGAKFLSREENGMVVILSVSCVLFLLQEGPATHIFQTLRRVPQFNETHGLERKTHTHTHTRKRQREECVKLKQKQRTKPAGTR